MGLSPQILRLYLVTDRDLCSERGVVDTVAKAIRGGVTCVQLRDKLATKAELVELARALRASLRQSSVPLLINDDIEAAVAADADGVHVGQEDFSPTQARDAVGPDKIIGLSCETPAHIRAADPRIVDYLGVGTVFGTQTKSDHSQPIGLRGLAGMCAESPLPTVAIGGLKAHHKPAVLAAGADGLAVVSAICGQPDPEAAARQFL